MIFQTVPVPLLFAITVISHFLVCFSRAYFSKRISDSTGDYHLFAFILSLICALMIFIIGGFSIEVSCFTLMCAVIFGILTMLHMILFSVAVNFGTLSYTTIINSSSIMMTSLSGFLFWGEDITAIQIAGIILMLVCYILSTKTEELKNEVTLKWLLASVALAIVTAVIGLCQKFHQESEYSNQITMFLVITFITSAIFSFMLYLIEAKKQKKYKLDNKEKLSRKKFILTVTVIILVNAVALAFNNVINLYLSGEVNSAIFFPIVNGAGILLNVMSSVVIFKEYLSVRQWIGVASGVSAVILLCI
ncbi:MAG: DUF2304 family protein [Clostridia bacterium]|nr:DUF2304 family protein [Clostridia bacterium]